MRVMRIVILHGGIMKISKVIEKLEKFKKRYGEVEVMIGQDFDIQDPDMEYYPSRDFQRIDSECTLTYYVEEHVRVY